MAKHQHGHQHIIRCIKINIEHQIKIDLFFNKNISNIFLNTEEHSKRIQYIYHDIRINIFLIK
jgi:hypothetical protein